MAESVRISRREKLALWLEQKARDKKGGDTFRPPLRSIQVGEPEKKVTNVPRQIGGEREKKRTTTAGGCENVPFRQNQGGEPRIGKTTHARGENVPLRPNQGESQSERKERTHLGRRENPRDRSCEKLSRAVHLPRSRDEVDARGKESVTPRPIGERQELIAKKEQYELSKMVAHTEWVTKKVEEEKLARKKSEERIAFLEEVSAAIRAEDLARRQAEDELAKKKAEVRLAQQRAVEELARQKAQREETVREAKKKLARKIQEERRMEIEAKRQRSVEREDSRRRERLRLKELARKNAEDKERARRKANESRELSRGRAAVEDAAKAREERIRQRSLPRRKLTGETPSIERSAELTEEDLLTSFSRIEEIDGVQPKIPRNPPTSPTEEFALRAPSWTDDTLRRARAALYLELGVKSPVPLEFTPSSNGRSVRRERTPTAPLSDSDSRWARSGGCGVQVAATPPDSRCASSSSGARIPARSRTHSPHEGSFGSASGARSAQGVGTPHEGSSVSSASGTRIASRARRYSPHETSLVSSASGARSSQAAGTPPHAATVVSSASGARNAQAAGTPPHAATVVSSASGARSAQGVGTPHEATVVSSASGARIAQGVGTPHEGTVVNSGSGARSAQGVGTPSPHAASFAVSTRAARIAQRVRTPWPHDTHCESSSSDALPPGPATPSPGASRCDTSSGARIPHSAEADCAIPSRAQRIAQRLATPWPHENLCDSTQLPSPIASRCESSTGGAPISHSAFHSPDANNVSAPSGERGESQDPTLSPLTLSSVNSPPLGRDIFERHATPPGASESQANACQAGGKLQPGEINYFDSSPEGPCSRDIFGHANDTLEMSGALKNIFGIGESTPCSAGLFPNGTVADCEREGEARTGISPCDIDLFVSGKGGALGNDVDVLATPEAKEDTKSVGTISVLSQTPPKKSSTLSSTDSDFFRRLYDDEPPLANGQEYEDESMLTCGNGQFSSRWRDLITTKCEEKYLLDQEEWIESEKNLTIDDILSRAHDFETFYFFERRVLVSGRVAHQNTELELIPEYPDIPAAQLKALTLRNEL